MDDGDRIIRWIVNALAAVGAIIIIGLAVLLAANASSLLTIASIISLTSNYSMYEFERDRMFDGALKGVVASTGDPYAMYMNRYEWENMQEDYQGKFGGVGIYVVQDPEGRLLIAAPIKGTPAEHAGLKSSDLILEIDGKATSEMDQDQAVNMIRGEPGTQVILLVYQSEERLEKDFVLTREIIDVPSVSHQLVENHPEIGYISLVQFHNESPREFSSALQDLQAQGVRALILDLRDNTGGDFVAAVSIADIFLGKQSIVSEVAANGDERRHTGQLEANDCDLPLVLLTNYYSASASEVLAAALQDNDRAVLVGTRTFGKGVIQNIFPLFNGGALKITTEKYLTPDGRDIDGAGIAPDYEVINETGSLSDLQLDKAVELLLVQLETSV